MSAKKPDDPIEREIDDEMLFEEYLCKIKVSKHKCVSNILDLRRDYRERIEAKSNESQFRNSVAGILRLMRHEAHNGYGTLKKSEQERILNCRVLYLANLFENSDIYFSKRFSCKDGTNRNLFQPLRKEVTIIAMRAYHSKGLLNNPSFDEEDPIY